MMIDDSHQYSNIVILVDSNVNLRLIVPGSEAISTVYVLLLKLCTQLT